MQRFFYLLAIFFAISFLYSQNPKSEGVQTEAVIKNKLIEINRRKLDVMPQYEKQLLSLKEESDELHYAYGQLWCGYNLMYIYGVQNKYKQTLELASQLKKISYDDPSLNIIMSSIYRRNALAMGYLGLSDASLKELKSALRIAEAIDDKNQRLYEMGMIYHSMSMQYNIKQFENKKYRDSIPDYYRKSQDLLYQLDDNSKTITSSVKYDAIAFNNMRLGIFYLEQADTKTSVNVEKAEKYLLDALNVYENKAYDTPVGNRIMILNQVSWLYMTKEEYQKSIDFANRALQLENKYKDPYHRVESFEFLGSCYLETGDKEKSKYYTDKYTYLKDSLNRTEKLLADTTMKKMVAETNKTNQENRKQQWLWTGIFVLFAAIITIILWRRKNKIMRTKYEQMIEKLKNEAALPSDTADDIEDTHDDDNTDLAGESEISASKYTISTETETRLLKKLNAFEKSEKFLRKDITIGLVAGQMNTNAKYLSEIIRNQKLMNFNNYINVLRINYILQKLYNEPKYREYKVSYLAEECGYASSQVFVIAFKKVSGVTPSYFIQSLKEDHSLVYN